MVIWTIKKLDQKKYYHQVTDEVQPDWDLSGAVQIIRWAREIEELLGKNSSLPAFKADSPFQRPETDVKEVQPH